MDAREKLTELPIEDALLVLREEHRQQTDSYTTYLAHGGKGDPAEEVCLDALADWCGHSMPARNTKEYAANNWGRIMDGHPMFDMAYELCKSGT